MEKRGIGGPLMDNLVYILFVVVFLMMMFLGVARAGSSSTLYEQVYAKQIALVIDKAEPGIEVELDIYDLYNFARKNKFNGEVVKIDNSKNKVSVKVVDGEGYDFYYFKDINIVWNLDKKERELYLEFVDKEDGAIDKEESEDEGKLNGEEENKEEEISNGNE